MNYPLISVVVPIYNVEKYITNCVKSLMDQDYKNIEIILVDDGSPDKSGLIIDELKKNDDRIVVIHKANGGVSSARNAGMQVAKGEYITFVDGDDWVDTNYVSYFLALIKFDDCEIAMNKNNYSDYNTTSKDFCYTVSAEKAIEWIYLGDVFVAVWNKMYKLDFIKRNNISFDESIWYGEGMLFNIDCLQFVDKVAIGELNVYHQVSNPQSAMRKFNLESNHCGIRSLEVQKQHWRKYNSRIEAAWDYHRRAFYWSIMGGLARSDMENDHREEYDACAKALRHNLWISLRVPIPMREKIRYICLAISPYYMALRAKRAAVIQNRSGQNDSSKSHQMRLK